MCAGNVLRRLIAVFLAVVYVLLLGPVKTFANSDGDEDRDEATRWVPAIGVNWGLAFQETRATVASSVLSGSDPPEFVRPPATGTTTMFTPFVGGQFELMTPRLIGRFGQPRFFARVDLNAAWGFSYDVAREGSPGELIRPETGLPEGDVIGQGSVTNATVETFMLGAGGGVAFTIDKGGRRFRIRPSVEYLREQLRIRGVVNRAVSLEPGELLPTNFRFIEMEAEQTHTPSSKISTVPSQRSGPSRSRGGGSTASRSGCGCAGFPTNGFFHWLAGDRAISLRRRSSRAAHACEYGR